MHITTIVLTCIHSYIHGREGKISRELLRHADDPLLRVEVGLRNVHLYLEARAPPANNDSGKSGVCLARNFISVS